MSTVTTHSTSDFNIDFDLKEDSNYEKVKKELLSKFGDFLDGLDPSRYTHLSAGIHANSYDQ